MGIPLTIKLQNGRELLLGCGVTSVVGSNIVSTLHANISRVIIRTKFASSFIAFWLHDHRQHQYQHFWEDVPMYEHRVKNNTPKVL